MTFSGKTCQSCLQNGQNHCMLTNTQGVCCDKGDSYCSQTAINYGSNLYCSSNVNYDFQTSVYTCPTAARCPQTGPNILLSQFSQVNGFSDSWSWFQYIQGSVCKYKIYTQVPQSNIILQISQVSGGASLIILIMDVNTFEFPIQTYQIVSSSQQKTFNISGTYFQFYIYILPDSFSSGSYRISAYIEQAWQPQTFVFDNSLTSNTTQQQQQSNSTQISNNTSNQTTQISQNQSTIQVNQQVQNQTQQVVIISQQNTSTDIQPNQQNNQNQSQQTNQYQNQSLILNPFNQSQSPQQNQSGQYFLLQDANMLILIAVISVIVCVLIIFFSILICCLSKSKEIFKEQLELNQKIIFHQQKDIRQVLNEIEYLHNSNLNLKDISKHNNENEVYQTTEPVVSTMAGNSNLNASYSVKQSNAVSQNWKSSVTKNTNISPQNFSSNSKLIQSRNFTQKNKIKEFTPSSNSKIHKNNLQNKDIRQFGFPFQKSIIENKQSPKFKEYQSSRRNNEIYKTQDVNHQDKKVPLSQIQEEIEVYKRRNISRDFMNNSTGKFLNLKNALDQSSDSNLEQNELKKQKLIDDILDESNEMYQEIEVEVPLQKNMNNLLVSKYNNAIKSSCQITSSNQDYQNDEFKQLQNDQNSNIFNIQKLQENDNTLIEDMEESKQNQIILDLRKKKDVNDFILRLPSQNQNAINGDNYLSIKKQKSNLSDDFANFFRNFSFMKNQDFKVEKFQKNIEIENNLESKDENENQQSKVNNDQIEDFLKLKRQLTKAYLQDNIKLYMNEKKCISQDSFPQSIQSSNLQQSPPIIKEYQKVQPAIQTKVNSSSATTKQINPMSQISSKDPIQNDQSEKIIVSQIKPFFMNKLVQSKDKLMINQNYKESRYDQRPYNIEGRKSQILNTIDNLVFSSENNDQDSFHYIDQNQLSNNQNLTLDVRNSKNSQLQEQLNFQKEIYFPNSKHFLRRDSQMFEIYKKQKQKIFDIQQKKFSRKLDIDNLQIKPVEVHTTVINCPTIPHSENRNASNSSWLYQKNISPYIDDFSSQVQHSEYAQNYNIQQIQNAKVYNNFLILNDQAQDLNQSKISKVQEYNDIEKNQKNYLDSLNYQSIQNIELTINDCQLQQNENTEHSKTPNFKINNNISNSNVSNEKNSQLTTPQQHLNVQQFYDIQSQLNFDYDLAQQKIYEQKKLENSPQKKMKHLFNKFLNIFKKESKNQEEKKGTEEAKKCKKDEIKIVELSKIEELSQEIEDVEQNQYIQQIHNMNTKQRIINMSIQDVDQVQQQDIQVGNDQINEGNKSYNFEDLTIINNENDTSRYELIEKGRTQIIPILNKSYEIMNLSQDYSHNRDNIQENQFIQRNQSSQRNKSMHIQTLNQAKIKNDWLFENIINQHQNKIFINHNQNQNSNSTVIQNIIQQNEQQNYINDQNRDNQNGYLEQNIDMVTPRTDRTIIFSPDNNQTNHKLINILNEIKTQQMNVLDQSNQIEYNPIIKLIPQNEQYFPKDNPSFSEIPIILSSQNSQQFVNNQNQFDLEFEFNSTTQENILPQGIKSIQKKMILQDSQFQDQKINIVNNSDLQVKYKQNKLQLQSKKEIQNLETPNPETQSSKTNSLEQQYDIDLSENISQNDIIVKNIIMETQFQN